MFEHTKPIADVGDIVYIDGSQFEVLSISYEYHKEPYEEFDEVYYLVRGVNTGVSFTIDQLEISAVEKPKQSERLSIDDLLLDLSDWLALVERFGEDEYYRRKINEIKAKIKEASE